MALYQIEKGNVRTEGYGLNDLNINLNIKAISVDSRTVLPGGLFVAIKGTKVDGHHFIQDAIRRGAVAIITEEPIGQKMMEATEGVSFIHVDDSKAALAHLVTSFFGHPADDLKLIGITGTNGKTTTCYLVDSLLRAYGLKSGRLSTITYRIGDDEMKATHTTPGLLALQGLFAKMREAGISHVAMEVSSHALDQGRVAGCDFEAMVFTNLTEEHLDYHHSMEAYYQCKKRLCAMTTGRCLINKDDLWGKRLLAELTQETWSYGIENTADIFPKQFVFDLNGIVMTVQNPTGEIEVRSPLIGRYNVYNLLAAIGVGLSLGLSGKKIASGIAAMPGVPGRFEKIDMGQNFTVIVDYAHTADALFRLLQTVSEIASKRIITLFGCGGDRDRGKRPKMAAAAAALSQKVILTSDNPRSESPLAIIREIEAGFHPEEVGFTEPSVDYEMISDREEAISRAIQVAAPGDVVVIAGKGHETDQQIGEQRFSFDDRKVAREALKNQLAK